MKVVVNRCWGSYPHEFDEDRTSDKVIALANESNYLEVIEIPDDAFYIVTDYDGMESILWSMSPINHVVHTK